MATDKHVIDVQESTFEQDVIRESSARPVVVDFWAPWCGPCRMLGPTLERLAEEGDGAWLLAKVNVDDNPGVSARFGVQGIPAVKAFVNGEVVDEFVGAQPEPNVRRFLDGLGPSETDSLTEAGREAEAAGDLESAERQYRAALAKDDTHAAARLGLGRVLLDRDEADEAVEILETVPVRSPERKTAERLMAKARFRSKAGVSLDETEARRRVSAEPEDLSARLDLAAALMRREKVREALEGMLQVLERSVEGDDVRERAHRDMLAAFDMLGDDHELTDTYRRRMAAALW